MGKHHRSVASSSHASKKNARAPTDSYAIFREYAREIIPSRPLKPSPLVSSALYGLPLDLVTRIRSFPLFQSAPESFLAAIGPHLRPQMFSPGDHVITEGDEAKAMYWLVRGAVSVSSRDGESTYVDLKPGAPFGEIGILMDIPRTATIVAKMKSLTVRLSKDDLQKVLPDFPEVDRAIRDEAKERLAILQRMKNAAGAGAETEVPERPRKRSRDFMPGDLGATDSGQLLDGKILSNKKRKSPSPGLAETVASSALGSGLVTIRQLLRELPLFSDLPPETLHFLGLNAQQRTYPPFQEIIRQDTQGREVFFIIRGEVEVFTEKTDRSTGTDAAGRRLSKSYLRARLKPGQYFGEVTSLSLAPRRTATVRSITSIECLVIRGETLDELWQQCPPEVRQQVEQTARARLQTQDQEDAEMTDVFHGAPDFNELSISERTVQERLPSLPTLSINASIEADQSEPMDDGNPTASMSEPRDPDPFISPGLDSVRARTRRASLAPPSPDGPQLPPSDLANRQTTQSIQVPQTHSPLVPGHAKSPSRLSPSSTSRRQRTMNRRVSDMGKGRLPDIVLVRIFQTLDIRQLLRLRSVSPHWCKLLTTSPDLLHMLDLSRYNRHITDATLIDVICPFAGNRPRIIDMSNCFHVTDEGFIALVESCAQNVRIWRMKSVWDITPHAVLEMANRAKALEEVDLSNCRKVSDNLLARVVGWAVPDTTPPFSLSPKSSGGQRANAGSVGCPQLKRVALSYCKHISDRSMAHLAAHAASRLEEIDLTRCTSISDAGFHHWAGHDFSRLRKLCLADCTYLSDRAVVHLSHAARGLRELDLSFCCALSDTSIEVLSLSLPHLSHLDLSFCGSAVSDSSLGAISLHLLALQHISVRGCVRVTGAGVEAVLDGCPSLAVFDVSQCRSLTPWLEAAGPARWPAVRFAMVRRKSAAVMDGA